MVRKYKTKKVTNAKKVSKKTKESESNLEIKSGPVFEPMIEPVSEPMTDPMIDPVVEPEVDPEPKPELEIVEMSKEEPKEVPKEKPKKEIRKAVPTASVLSHETAKALKTCVKFVAGWRHLKKDVPFTAPTEVIRALRDRGFVE